MRENFVSVILPCYNSEAYLSECLDSVLSQTYENFEVLAVDDASKDATLDILRQYEKKDARVRVYRLDRNTGASAARNCGIRKASEGEFFAFIDADDLWYPGKLEKQISFMGSHPSVGLLYCLAATNVHGPDTSETSRKKRQKILRGKIPARRFLFETVIVSVPTVLLRRICVERAGMFNEAYRVFEDIEYWFRISREFELDCIEEELVNIRRHDKNTSLDRITSKECRIHFFEEMIMRDSGIMSELSTSVKKRVQGLHYSLARAYARAGRLEDARQEFHRTLEYRILSPAYLKTRLRLADVQFKRLLRNHHR